MAPRWTSLPSTSTCTARCHDKPAGADRAPGTAGRPPASGEVLAKRRRPAARAVAMRPGGGCPITQVMRGQGGEGRALMFFAFCRRLFRRSAAPVTSRFRGSSCSAVGAAREAPCLPCPHRRRKGRATRPFLRTPARQCSQRPYIVLGTYRAHPVLAGAEAGRAPPPTSQCAPPAPVPTPPARTFLPSWAGGYVRAIALRSNWRRPHRGRENKGKARDRGGKARVPAGFCQEVVRLRWQRFLRSRRPPAGCSWAVWPLAGLYSTSTPFQCEEAGSTPRPGSPPPPSGPNSGRGPPAAA